MNAIRDALEKAKVKSEAKSANMILRVPMIRKVKAIAAEQETINKAVEEARQYIAAIPGHIVDLIKRIREIQAASVEEQAIRSKELKDLEDEVLTHLNSEEELLASAARQAYAMAMVETLPADKRLVAETIKGNSNSRLPGLLDLKILEPAGDAKNVFTVKVYGDTYKVGGSRDFATKLAENLSTGAAHAAKAAHELYHSEMEALKSKATISVAEMRARKSGSFFLDVPDLKKDGKFLPGGALLAESDGKEIRIIRACGHFQRLMTEIAEAGTFVPIKSLSSERLELSKRLSEDAFRRVRVLHAILRRGLAEAQKVK